MNLLVNVLSVYILFRFIGLNKNKTLTSSPVNHTNLVVEIDKIAEMISFSLSFTTPTKTLIINELKTVKT